MTPPAEASAVEATAQNGQAELANGTSASTKPQDEPVKPQTEQQADDDGSDEEDGDEAAEGAEGGAGGEGSKKKKSKFCWLWAETVDLLARIGFVGG